MSNVLTKHILQLLFPPPTTPGRHLSSKGSSATRCSPLAAVPSAIPRTHPHSPSKLPSTAEKHSCYSITGIHQQGKSP